ncbi:hypothetical protein [Phytomonospora endophytica]|uniref:RHIM domain-containing protein n=1 Tax=Phytomonospora endophytica TaxID=714109 RepID=A0A841FTA4_9ACTN|nr:hypothetical protein [Phytomonospora endophytica]MBB6038033.1 hypothetical protein [Phytomonospora endophytica]GIG68934.1 hypothetical protein Pen01_52290 [Phytomonospora endophytica]
MTGLEVVVAALVAGAADSAKNLVGDTYTGLKGYLSRKLAEHREARAALEADEVESGVWRARLTEELAGTGIGNDAEAVELARKVLALADPGGKYTVDLREAKGVQVGDGNTQTNTFN